MSELRSHIDIDHLLSVIDINFNFNKIFVIRKLENSSEIMKDSHLFFCDEVSLSAHALILVGSMPVKMNCCEISRLFSLLQFPRDTERKLKSERRANLFFLLSHLNFLSDISGSINIYCRKMAVSQKKSVIF